MKLLKRIKGLVLLRDIFEAIFKQDQSNQILYKYLIDYLRDNGIERLNHTYFVTQGTNLAYMFKNSEPIKDFLREHFIRESSQTDDIKELDLLALIKAESLKYCRSRRRYK